MINYELMFDFERTYVLPLLIKPGRTHFFVRDVFDINITTDIMHRRRETLNSRVDTVSSNPEAHHKFWYSRHIVDLREEPVPKIPKILKRAFKSETFVKEYSVFKDWREDTKHTLEKSLIHDFKYWKVAKFIKEPDEYVKIQRILTDNFVDLKEIFMQVVARGG